MPVHGSGLGGPDQPLQLGTTVVLGLGCQFLDVDIASEQVEASHLVGVDGQNLDTPLLIRQTWRSHEEALSARGRGIKTAKMGSKFIKRHEWSERLEGERRAPKEALST